MNGLILNLDLGFWEKHLVFLGKKFLALSIKNVLSHGTSLRWLKLF